MWTEKFNLYVNDNQIQEKDTQQTSESQPSQAKLIVYYTWKTTWYFNTTSKKINTFWQKKDETKQPRDLALLFFSF